MWNVHFTFLRAPGGEVWKRAPQWPNTPFIRC